LLFHYDILTRTTKQLFEDRFGIAFRTYIIETRRYFNHFNDLRENIIPKIFGAHLLLHNRPHNLMRFDIFEKTFWNTHNTLL